MCERKKFRYVDNIVRGDVRCKVICPPKYPEIGDSSQEIVLLIWKTAKHCG